MPEAAGKSGCLGKDSFFSILCLPPKTELAVSALMPVPCCCAAPPNGELKLLLPPNTEAVEDGWLDAAEGPVSL